jgi:hypothetical protein
VTELHAKHSEDGGLTWRSWRGPGLSGKIDGTDGVDNGSSGGDHWVLLTPYGQHVACVFRKDRTISLLSCHDGKAWSKPEPAAKGSPLSAATLKDRDLFVSTDSGVYRWDGSAGVQEQGARGDGLLAAAGREKVLLFGIWETGRIACQQRKAKSSLAAATGPSTPSTWKPANPCGNARSERRCWPRSRTQTAPSSPPLKTSGSAL